MQLLLQLLLALANLGWDTAQLSPAGHATARSRMQVTPIYSNGKLLSNWRETSVGCDACVLQDVSAARNTSTASFSAKVAERGILRLTSLATYPSNRCILSTALVE